MSGAHREPADPGRRRFIAVLASIFGVGTIATIIRNRGASTSTSSSGVSTSTTSGTPASSTTAGPTSTTVGTTTEASTTTSDATSTTTTSDPTTTTTTEPTTTTTEAETTTTTQAQTTVTTSPPEAGGGDLLVLEKAAWGGQPSGDGFESHSPARITVHHTAAVLGTNSKAPARIRQHQNYHQSQGWPDIAYHVMIDQAGNFYEGRPFEFRGDTFTSYDPSGHFLPCLEGDYNSEEPTAVQMEALAQLCAWAAQRWGIDPATIGGHRDYAATSCPGGKLYDDVSSGTLAGRVNEILAGGAPGLSFLRGAEAASIVAAIEAGG